MCDWSDGSTMVSHACRVLLRADLRLPIGSYESQASPWVRRILSVQTTVFCTKIAAATRAFATCSRWQRAFDGVLTSLC